MAARRGLQGRQRVQDRITVSASGTAAQVERAFGTKLENFKLNGRTVRLATKELSVPASLGRSVIGAMGVNQNVATPDAAAATASPAPATNPFLGPGRLHHFSAV